MGAKTLKSLCSKPGELVCEMAYDRYQFLVGFTGLIAVSFLFVIMMLNIKLTEVHENIFRYIFDGE